METRRHLVEAVVSGLVAALASGAPPGLAATPRRRAPRKRTRDRQKRQKRKRRRRQRFLLVPHWRAGTTIPILDRTSGEWRQAVRDMVVAWNAQLGGLVQLVHQEDAGSGVVTGAIVIVSPQVNQPWRGAANLEHDRTGYITSASISLDDADYAGRFPWPETVPRGSLVCHELGHALGLGHTPAGTGGCMAEDRLAHGDPPNPSSYTIALLRDMFAQQPRRR